jgi:hypothetical protein
MTFTYMTDKQTNPEQYMINSIGQQAIDFIIEQEDGPKAYYERTEEHFDWPGGASGPTIGVGYDLGYVTREECIEDWTGILTPDQIQVCLAGRGLNGDWAHAFVRTHHDAVTVTWDQAVQQFIQRELPKWYGRCLAVLEHFEELPPLCRGMLVSLAYNRGVDGFRSPLPRYAEMHNIFVWMEQRQFDLIAEEIEGMRRLWPVGGDLWKRRMSEAQLFKQGLEQWKPSQNSDPTSGSAASSTSPPSSPPAPSPSPT